MLVVASAFGAGQRKEEPTVAVEGEPQYGGTLTMFARAQFVDPSSPDRMLSSDNSWDFMAQSFQEMPLVGDFEKYGPRGTGEYDFTLRGFSYLQYMKGCLLESWDITPEKIVWNVRPGVYWHGNRPHVMESRELTAEDMAWWVRRMKSAAAGKEIRRIFGDVYATDRYTCVIEFGPDGYNGSGLYFIGYEDRSNVEPPETVELGAADWDNHVGTGAFMNTEYVHGSYFRFERNPNYWGTTTIDGKEYQLPFADEVMRPIMPDVATQMAALRTGVIDWFEDVPATQWDNLAKTAPELTISKDVSARGYCISLKLDNPILSNIDVRKALMIGTDIKAFQDLLGLEGVDIPVNWYPIYVGNKRLFTPLEELPARTQKLFEYNPTLAKQMLKDAGYPDGFKIALDVSNREVELSQGELVVDQWSKIGVEVDLLVKDPVTHSAFVKDKLHTAAVLDRIEVADPIIFLLRQASTGSLLNTAGYSSKEMDDTIAKIAGEIDIDKKNSMLAEPHQALLDAVPYIPSQCTILGFAWWPWIKNYYGETNVQDNQAYQLWNYMWIDQDLKKKMGF
jgi:peptide/nickel transport system substrate-binding protein